MRLLFLMLILLTTGFAMAQSDYEIIEKLDRAGLILTSEKDAIIKDTKTKDEFAKKNKKNIYTNPKLAKMPHYPLGVLVDAKKYSTSGSLSSIFFIEDDINVEKGKEKQLMEKLDSFSSKLSKSGLISKKTSSEIYSKIDSLQLKSEFQIAHFAQMRTEAEYFLSSKHFKKFADGLLARQLITEPAYEELLKKSMTGELRNYDEPFAYLKNFLTIDLKEYPANPENYIEKIFRRTSEVLPELKYDSLSYKIEKDKQESIDDFIAYNLIVRISQNGKKYIGSSFYDAEYKNKKTDKIPKIDVGQYYEVFNKILADKGSVYRLHFVSIEFGKFGVIALTKRQFEGLVWSPDGMIHDGFIRLSYENFNNKVTQNKIEEAINLYDSIGLLSHLTKKEKDSCISEIKDKQVNYFSDVLSCFKDLVFEIDLKYGVDDAQYKKLTKEIAKASKGHFNPQNIIDEYKYENNKNFEYSFTLNGKQYKTRLNQPDKWLDLKFYELIERALAEQNKNGKFYLLYPNDGMRQIFLTDEQFKILKEKKLIELSDSDIEDN